MATFASEESANNVLSRLYVLQHPKFLAHYTPRYRTYVLNVMQ